jgi:S1-C subfamily serine protease|tara:strand:+ start:3452 stop:4204 length:753 start_codon:yes stop_codon:yes gene_type:complete
MYTAFLFLSLMFVSPSIEAMPPENVQPQDFITISRNINAAMTATEQKVREAAVKVKTTEGGHGSGSLIAYKDLQFVFTAEHVVDDGINPVYLIEKFGMQRLGIVVYADEVHDIAVLYLPEPFTSIKAIKFEPYSRILEIGEEVTFSGYPSNHQLMTVRGRVAGYEHIKPGGTQIIIHTYGWFGSSGSAVYTARGKLAGILWGIDLEYPGGMETPQIIEDMMWVIPIKNLKIEEAIEVVCDNFNTGLRACR